MSIIRLTHSNCQPREQKLEFYPTQQRVELVIQMFFEILAGHAQNRRKLRSMLQFYKLNDDIMEVPIDLSVQIHTS